MTHIAGQHDADLHYLNGEHRGTPTTTTNLAHYARRLYAHVEAHLATQAVVVEVHDLHDEAGRDPMTEPITDVPTMTNTELQTAFHATQQLRQHLEDEAKRMKLWLLKRLSEPDWNQYDGFVVRAADEAQARQLAHEAASEQDDQGNIIYESEDRWWLDATVTSCELISDTGKPEIILSSNVGA